MLDEKFDLEKDLKNSEIINEKAKNDSYAQNLYAAICNNCWQPLDLMSIFLDDYWDVSWRGAGRIVAEIRQCGEDYIDFYCSGILTEDDGIIDLRYEDKAVSEGTITDEIKNDLFILGWKRIEERR